MRTCKGKDLIIDYPIEISVLNLLKVLIFFDIELTKVKEAVGSSLRKSSETIQNSEIVRASAGTGIMKGLEGHCILNAVYDTPGRRRTAIAIGRDSVVHTSQMSTLEADKSLLWTTIHVKDLPGAYKVRRVGPLGGGGAGVVANDHVGKAGVLQLVAEHLAEAVEVAEVKWAKVEEEVPVDKLIVDRKVVNGTRFWVAGRWVGYDCSRVAGRV
mmetsp:Transcript_25514/g.55771  ORF Transcript_25514/g.55771 Transcript_25514/m.55771 type:complete len:213 (-) Transcript_25514:102-740(-)